MSVTTANMVFVALAMVAAAAVPALLPRLPALLLYRAALPGPMRAGLALHSGTQLSLVVAITGIAVQQHLMPANQATALVFAGIVTVILFPSLARLCFPLAAGIAPRPAPIGEA